MKFCSSDIQEYVEANIKNHTLLTEEQKEDEKKYIFNTLLEKLDNAQSIIDLFQLEKWMETEQFKQDILPTLLFDYMNTNREEYKDYATRLYYLTDL